MDRSYLKYGTDEERQPLLKEKEKKIDNLNHKMYQTFCQKSKNNDGNKVDKKCDVKYERLK